MIQKDPLIEAFSPRAFTGRYHIVNGDGFSIQSEYTAKRAFECKRALDEHEERCRIHRQNDRKIQRRSVLVYHIEVEKEIK